MFCVYVGLHNRWWVRFSSSCHHFYTTGRQLSFSRAWEITFNFKENFRNHGIVIIGVAVMPLKVEQLTISCRIGAREMSGMSLWVYNHLWKCSGSLAWPKSHSQRSRGGDFSPGKVREFEDISSSSGKTELPACTQRGQLKGVLKTLGGTTKLEEKVACATYNSANVISQKFNVLITSFPRLSSYFPHPLARLLCISKQLAVCLGPFPCQWNELSTFFILSDFTLMQETDCHFCRRNSRLSFFLFFFNFQKWEANCIVT